MRRARATTATVVPGTRCMCPRAVEAPGACAARIGCHKLRTVPGAALQRRAAGVRRRPRRRRRGLRDARPRREPDGGHIAPAPEAAQPRGTRWAPPACRRCPDVSLAVGPRFRCCGGRVCMLDRTKCQAVGWLTFGSGKCGKLRALTPRVCACVLVAVEMPFSSTFSAAAGGTEVL